MLAYNRNFSIQEAEINTDFLNDSLTYFLVKARELVWTPPVLDGKLQESSCLGCPTAEITGMDCHAWPF